MVENGLKEWEITIVKLTTDDHFRLRSQVLFKARTAYDAQKQADGSVIIRELVPLESKSRLVELRTYNGMLIGAEPLSAEEIARVTREERDAQ